MVTPRSWILGEIGPDEFNRHHIRDHSTFISLPKAEGYAEGDLTLYHRTSVTDFLRAANPVDFLSKASEVSPTFGGMGRESQKHGLNVSQILSLLPNRFHWMMKS